MVLIIKIECHLTFDWSDPMQSLYSNANSIGDRRLLFQHQIRDWRSLDLTNPILIRINRRSHLQCHWFDPIPFGTLKSAFTSLMSLGYPEFITPMRLNRTCKCTTQLFSHAIHLNFSFHMDITLRLVNCLIEYLIQWHNQLQLRLNQRYSINLVYVSRIQIQAKT